MTDGECVRHTCELLDSQLTARGYVLFRCRDCDSYIEVQIEADNERAWVEVEPAVSEGEFIEIGGE